MTKRIGRPTKYKPDYDDLAYRLALLGSTEDEMAIVFNVSGPAIDRWKSKHEAFRCAIARGRLDADAHVAHALYRRALGDERTPPDTNAASLWLRNRQPAKWRDRIEHSGPGGEALQIQIVRYAEPQPKVIEHEPQAVDSPALIEAAAPAAEEAPIYIDSSTDPAGAREEHQVVEIRRFADERKSQR